MLKKIFTKILFIFIFCFIAGLALPSKADDSLGCCEMISKVNSNTKQFTTSAQDKCKEDDYYFASFHPNQVPSVDNDRCTDSNLSATLPKEQPKISEPITPTLSVAIPGLVKFTPIKCDNPNDPCSVPWLSEYLLAIYKYSLMIIGILAVIVMMIGGIMWLTAGGSKGQIGAAQDYIKSGILGVIIMICSYLILYILSPNLVVLNPLKVSYIGKQDLETMETNDEIIDAQTDNEKYPNTQVIDPNNFKPSDAKGCDNCVITTLQTKNNKNLNKDLNAKLVGVKSSVQFIITEAFPPTSKHQAKCHSNGHCVDIGIRPLPASCAQVSQLLSDLKNAGLKVLNEYTGCGGTQTKYGNGGHMHVSE